MGAEPSRDALSKVWHAVVEAGPDGVSEAAQWIVATHVVVVMSLSPGGSIRDLLHAKTALRERLD